MTAKYIGCFFAAVAVIATSNASPSLSQNPEKFERVVPAKPQPAAPTADALAREVMRKALAKQPSGDICTKLNWRKVSGSGDELDRQILSTLPPTATTTYYLEMNRDFINSCVAQQASADFREDGLRCKRVIRMYCSQLSSMNCWRSAFVACQAASGLWWKKRDL